MKCDRLQCQDCFAGLVHRFNRLLESPRRGRYAKVAVRVHNNCRACNVRTKDPSDKGVCLCPLAAYADRVRFASATRIADIDIVVSCGKLAAGTKTQRDVEVARIAAIKRKSTVSCVAIAAGVANEGVNTDCRVVLADVVVKKRLNRRLQHCCRRSYCWRAHQNR